MEYLFRDYDLHAVLENQREQMVRAINDADASVVVGRPVEDIADDFVHQFELDPPELTEGAISVDVEEAQVDVSGDPNRFFLDHDRPFYVPGIRATYHVPFTGDHNLFKCRPSTFSTVLPAVDSVRVAVMDSSMAPRDDHATVGQQRDGSVVSEARTACWPPANGARRDPVAGIDPDRRTVDDGHRRGPRATA